MILKDRERAGEESDGEKDVGRTAMAEPSHSGSNNAWLASTLGVAPLRTGAKRREEAGLVTDRRLGGELARDVPLASLCALRLDSLSRVKT